MLMSYGTIMILQRILAYEYSSVYTEGDYASHLFTDLKVHRHPNISTQAKFA